MTKPFTKKNSSNVATVMATPAKQNRSASQHLKTYCYSTDYSKSRNSTDLFKEWNHREASTIKTMQMKKKMRGKKTKGVHSRHISRANEMSEERPRRRLTELESEILNLSSQINNSSSLMALTSNHFVSEPLASLVTSINTKLQHKKSVKTHEITEFLTEEIETLEQHLARLKIQNGKMRLVSELRAIATQQAQKLAEISQMQHGMQR